MTYLRTLKNFKGSMGVYGALGNNDFDLPVGVRLITENGFEKLAEPKN